MSRSLSIILPVRNAEEKLEQQVNAVLEVVSELTSEIELLIVDAGSTDDTEEVAMGLCCTYPQVRALRRSGQSGELAAAKVGIEHTSGEIVLIHDIESPLSGETIREFWAMRDDDELVFAQSENHRRQVQSEVGSGHGVTAWAGTQMLRRSAVDDLQRQQKDPPRINRVTRTDMADAKAPAALLQQLADKAESPPASSS